MKKKLPNIIFIVMDTVGAKHMSVYGYHRKTTPNLERIAKECTVYNRCFAPSCWTIPSHASMFTGLYPSQHGAHEGQYILHDNVQHLVSVLKLMGYQTMGISSNGLVSPDNGLCRDFDFFKNFGDGFFDIWKSRWCELNENELTEDLSKCGTIKEKLITFYDYIHRTGNINIALKKLTKNIIYRINQKAIALVNPNPTTKSSIYSENTIEIVREIVHSYKDKNDIPLFIFINLMEAHDLYRPPLRLRQFSRWHDKQRCDINHLYNRKVNNSLNNLMEKYNNLYDDEIYYLDDIVNRIWNTINSLPNFDETVVVLTSDHGEHLGEKGLYGHILSLYNDLIWVPLIIKFPKAFNKKGVEDRLVSLNDIYSTIMDLVESPLPCPDSSFSLLRDFKRDITLSQHIYPESFRKTIIKKEAASKIEGKEFSPPVFAMMTEAGIKTIENRDGSIQIFNLQRDVDEKHDLALEMTSEAIEDMRYMMKILKRSTYYQEALEQ